MNHENIFSISSAEEFEKISLEVFQYQYRENPVYSEFCDLLKVSPRNIYSFNNIPFLPIEFFKSKKILVQDKKPEITFTSSGTTGTQISKHYVGDRALYEKSFSRTFHHFYGPPEDYVILALLPAYMEREGSSLVYMVNHFIKQSKHPESGFYLNNLTELKKNLIDLDSSGKKVLLIGVSFALLDLVEMHQFQLKNTIVMETGGMKGRRKEMIREELHAVLKEGFGVSRIHSEYGMTELLTQAYSMGEGIFHNPPWMKILIRDPEDALTYVPSGKTGGINVIDLANLNSCSFIATQDLGKITVNNSVEILGRFDNSDIRGCNLLVL